MNVSFTLISQYERGIRKPKIETLWRMAEAIGVPKNYFFSNYYDYDGGTSDAIRDFKKNTVEVNAYDGMISILAAMYGGFEERVITGKVGSVSIDIFGKDDTAFYLNYEHIIELLDIVQSTLKPIIKKLTADQSLSDIIKAHQDYFDNPDNFTPEEIALSEKVMKKLRNNKG